MPPVSLNFSCLLCKSAIHALPPIPSENNLFMGTLTAELVYDVCYHLSQNPRKEEHTKFKFTKFPVRKQDNAKETRQSPATTDVMK